MINVSHDYLDLSGDLEQKGQIWKDHLAPVFDIEFGRDTDLGLPLKLENYLCGQMIIGSVRAPAQRLTRSRRKVSQQGVDHFLIQFYNSGSSKVYSEKGDIIPVTASHLILFDLSRSIETEAKAVDALNLVVPRSIFDDGLIDVEDLHAKSFDFASNPIRRMLHNYVRDLSSGFGSIGINQALDLSRAAAALCRACLYSENLNSFTQTSVIKLAIKQYVEENIDQFDLDIFNVASKFRSSRATLQRLFELEGGFASYVRERRLQRAFATLARPHTASRPYIYTVAHRCGFSDATTFSRAFQRRFSIAPRDVTPTTSMDSALHDKHMVLWSWMNQISIESSTT